MTPEELCAVGQTIRKKIQPVLEERGYYWAGGVTDDRKKYTIGFKKDLFNLNEIPLFVTVELP